MFTVEMEDHETEITTLDETGRFEDVTIFLDNTDICFLRQWNENEQNYEVLEMSWQQLNDLQAAINSPVGAFFMEKN